MAEIVVSNALDTIRTIVQHQAQLYRAVRSEISAVETELRLMRSFLKDADSKHTDSDDQVRIWVSEVREAAYDLEDILFVFAAVVRRPQNSRNPLNKIHALFNKFLATYRLSSQIPKTRRKISDFTARFQQQGMRSPISRWGPGGRLPSSTRNDWRKTYSHVVEDDIVGLGEVIKKLVAQLVGEGEQSQSRVISIYGMGGLGKTTIARKLYTHGEVRRHYDGFAWTCITQKLEKRDVLEGILIRLQPEMRADILGMREDELVKQLYQVQLKKRCLVVLDDVWCQEHLQRLMPAFPTKGGSKMLLTTRIKAVAEFVTPNYSYEPRGLNTDESWELLRKKAFKAVTEGKIDPDPQMANLGKKMVTRCCGLPLAILVLGGILSVTEYTRSEWEKVSNNMDYYFKKGGRGQQHAFTEVLAFSYHDLPFKFKQCFLYLANFPKGFEIEARRLYQLWLADGIISSQDMAENETMMDVAKRYLDELAQRSIVRVKVKETAGGFKSCLLHDRMRDICISEAYDSNFTRVIDFRTSTYTSSESTLPNPTKSTRRVSFHLDPSFSNHTLLRSDSRHVRSAFFHANGHSGSFLQQPKCPLTAFKLLRVLSLQGFYGATELPKAVGKLIHLRYLSISSSQFKKLPLSLGKLVDLQTLDLEVDTVIEIPNIIWKIKGLKHLYLPAKFVIQDADKLNLNGLLKLEILVNFNTSLCDVKDLDTLSSLRKLRAEIKGDLKELPAIISYISFKQNLLRRASLSISSPNFCSDEEMSQVRALLNCHRLHKLTIDGQIAKLPEYYASAASIAKISFKASKLVVDPMTILERLPKLSSLALHDMAYVGKEMTCSIGGFPRLLYLKLWGLPNLNKWSIEKGAMPMLTRLVVAHCDQLEMLPDGLQFLTTIRKMNVRSMPGGFKDRLKTVDGNEGDDFYKVRHIPDLKLDLNKVEFDLESQL